MLSSVGLLKPTPALPALNLAHLTSAFKKGKRRGAEDPGTAGRSEHDVAHRSDPSCLPLWKPPLYTFTDRPTGGETQWRHSQCSKSIILAKVWKPAPQ